MLFVSSNRIIEIQIIDVEIIGLNFVERVQSRQRQDSLKHDTHTKSTGFSEPRCTFNK